MASIDIRLKKVNKVYKEGEVVAGLVVVNSKGECQHQGINLMVDGVVNLQLSAKSVGVFEAFYNSLKPIHLLQYPLEIAKPGRLPSGKTEIPFEVPLKPKAGKTLYETYHGVFVNIQYMIRVEMKRSLLNKDLQKQCEFIIEYKTHSKERSCPRVDVTALQLQDLPSTQEEKAKTKPVTFTITPDTLAGVKEKQNIPKFKVKGKLESSCLKITEPLRGELTLEHCEVPVKSIEIQLVRVETCGCAEGYAKDATEIQNIQITDGDVCRNLPIPIYMIFPRLFTCPTLTTNNFKVDFEVNVVIIFHDDHLVTENFPIKLTRF